MVRIAALGGRGHVSVFAFFGMSRKAGGSRGEGWLEDCGSSLNTRSSGSHRVARIERRRRQWRTHCAVVAEVGADGADDDDDDVVVVVVVSVFSVVSVFATGAPADTV